MTLLRDLIRTYKAYRVSKRLTFENFQVSYHEKELCGALGRRHRLRIRLEELNRTKGDSTK